VEQNPEWESRVQAFARGLYGHEPFMASFIPFAERVAQEGERIALAQTLLKLTAPGVPDIYQGVELWSLNLVDPDNRRPVDWRLRRELLEGLVAGEAPTRETAKLHLIWKTLDLRARRTEAFAGSYEPLEAGPNVCAFVRGGIVLVAAAIAPDADYTPPEGYVEVLGAGPGIWLLERETKAGGADDPSG